MAKKTGKVDKLRPILQYLTICHRPPLEVAHPWRSWVLYCCFTIFDFLVVRGSCLYFIGRGGRWLLVYVAAFTTLMVMVMMGGVVLRCLRFRLGTMFYSPRNAFCYLTLALLALVEDLPLYFWSIAVVTVSRCFHHFCCNVMWHRWLHPLVIGNLCRRRSCHYPVTVILVARRCCYSCWSRVFIFRWRWFIHWRWWWW